ncbi:HDIG domain-containing metalloprotein [Microbacterium sp. B2969]|uniref:HDIG domain-containing metalloprotein n=1 Tax=Microbacterium alkaliflavum TaxID=3248839 RepID=A0ABW7QAK7_9MICO
MSDEVSEREWGGMLRTVAREASEPSSALRERGLIAAVPELAALAGTPQDPLWHPEGDVLVHSLWAADLAAARADAERFAPERRELVVLASLLHDIGKPATTRRRDGRLTSRGHAERGAEIVRALGRRLDWPGTLVRPIAAIVGDHMAHVSVQGAPSARAVRNLVSRLRGSEATLEDWAVVVKADGDARGSAARPDASIPWLRVARELGL